MDMTERPQFQTRYIVCTCLENYHYTDLLIIKMEMVFVAVLSGGGIYLLAYLAQPLVVIIPLSHCSVQTLQRITVMN